MKRSKLPLPLYPGTIRIRLGREERYLLQGSVGIGRTMTWEDLPDTPEEAKVMLEGLAQIMRSRSAVRV